MTVIFYPEPHILMATYTIITPYIIYVKGILHFFGNRLILQLPQGYIWVLPFSKPFSQFSDIWKNISNQTVSGLIDFHSRKKIYILWKSMIPETLWLLILF